MSVISPVGLHFLLLSFALFPAASLGHFGGLLGGLGVGGGCGCAPPPMCPPVLPPMPCMPPPPPCPPCPPTFCPPPVICPLPPPPCPPMLPPPPPCPPPSPCSPCGGGGGGYLGGPSAGYGYAQSWGGGGGVGPPSYMGGGGGYGGSGGYPSNDCCCQCGSPCRYMGRARTHGARIFAAPTTKEEEEDPTCNSEKLRTVIEENISDNDPSQSKRAIQKAAEEKLFNKINVICANGDFSYVAYTDSYCQATSGNVTCYAFQPLGLETSTQSSSSSKNA